jgi:hypothetical protein
MAIILKKPMGNPHGPAEAGCKSTKQIAALIDEVGAMQIEAEAKRERVKELQRELAPYIEKMRALTVLVSAIEGHDPDEIFDQEGALFVATVGRKVTVRTVSDPELAIKLLNKAEKGVAWKVISVPLGKLDAYLTPHGKAQVIRVDRGDRSVVIVKEAAQKAG